MLDVLSSCLVLMSLWVEVLRRLCSSLNVWMTANPGALCVLNTFSTEWV